MGTRTSWFPDENSTLVPNFCDGKSEPGFRRFPGVVPPRTRGFRVASWEVKAFDSPENWEPGTRTAGSQMAEPQLVPTSLHTQTKTRFLAGKGGSVLEF